MKLLLIIILHLIIADTVKESEKIDEYDFATDDFSVLSKTKYYVDKTLLIKDVLLEDETRILVAAPRRCGKSVNIDMLRRFLRIEIDERGNEIVDKMASSDYKLFGKLDIYQKHVQFFNEHFGNYPVIHIDYSPLRGIRNYIELLQQFGVVLRNTFAQHRFLERAETLWDDVLDIDDFTDYLTAEKKLDQNDIEYGFGFLADVLYRRFKRRVVVLVDNYNAFVDAAIFGNNVDHNDTVFFFQRINDRLLKHPCVDKAFMTGILRVMGLLFSPRITEFLHLRDHQFNRYYGLTRDEIEQLLLKNAGTRVARSELRNGIIRNYEGFTVMGNPDLMYNLLSVLNFLRNRYRPENTTALATENKNLLKFSSEEVRDQVVNLLQGKPIRIDISKPLSRDDILMLNAINARVNLEIGTRDLYVYLGYLFEHGYFTLCDRYMRKEHSICVKIPNLDIASEFFRTLRNSIIKSYNLQWSNIELINSCVNDISENTTTNQVFNIIGETFQRILAGSDYRPKSKTAVRNFLFAVFKSKFDPVHSDLWVNECDIVDITFTNDNGVNFVVNVKVTEHVTKRALNFRAKKSIESLIEMKYTKVEDLNCQNKFVYFGFCVSKLDRNIGFAYSRYLKENDNQTDIKIAVTN